MATVRITSVEQKNFLFFFMKVLQRSHIRPSNNETERQARNTFRNFYYFQVRIEHSGEAVKTLS